MERHSPTRHAVSLFSSRADRTKLISLRADTGGGAAYCTARPLALRVGSRQCGATLIKLAVAVLVLTVGLLGLAGLPALRIQNDYSADLSAKAVALAYDARDRMRDNRDAALAGAYTTTFTDPAPAGTTRAITDLREWKQLLAALPSGVGSISSAVVGPRTVFTVTVRWDDSRGILPKRKFSITSEL